VQIEQRLLRFAFDPAIYWCQYARLLCSAFPGDIDECEGRIGVERIESFRGCECVSLCNFNVLPVRPPCQLQVGRRCAG
jgi:hypothetical protein